MTPSIARPARAELTPGQKALILACGLLLIAGLICADNLPPFLPGGFLLAVTWKYSTLLSMPLAYLMLESLRREQVPRGPHLVILPFVIYFALARLVLFVPDLVVSLMGYPDASEVVAVSRVQESSPACGRQAQVEVAGYSTVSFDLCVPQSFAQTLLSGDKLRLEGKAGLGGLLVLRQVKL